MPLPTIAVLLLLAAPLARAATVPITACSAEVMSGDTGVLQNDLVCPAETYAAVTVQYGGTLDLNGYAIRGFAVKGVSCLGRCLVTSSVPGAEITGIVNGIFNWKRGTLTVRDLTVRDLVTYPDVPVDYGIEAPDATIVLERVAVHGAGDGVLGRRVRATGVDASGNVRAGLLAVATLRATDVVVTGNGTFGLAATRVLGTNVVATGNGLGGVRGRRVRIDTGTVTGNQPPLDTDVWALRRPTLVDVTCGRSQVIDAPLGTGFGVCAGD
jgi:hypothetical protein